MEVILEPNIVSDHIKAFLDDPKWPEHIKDPQLKQIKRRASMTNARKNMQRCKEEKLTFSARIKNCSASMLEKEGCIERIRDQIMCLKERLDEVRAEMLNARGDGMREACIQDMKKLRAKVKHLHAQSTIEKLGMQATSSTLSRILYEYYLADKEMIRHSVLLKHRKLRNSHARGGGG